jgi:uncharacterized membrane protein YfhO
LDNRQYLTDRITTSDSSFTEENWATNKAQLEYNLQFKRDEPEHIVFQLSSDDNAYLSLMDLWSRGWKAYIDGKETKIYRGYMGTRFIQVEKGEHIVEFKYTVPGLIVSSVISLLTWLLLLLFLIYGTYLKKVKIFKLKKS